MAQLVPGQHIHLVGIGGAGLSAIARILLQKGYRVSGSDRTPNALMAALAEEGATIYEGHATSNVQDADALIVTAAVQSDHIEVAAARRLGIPVYKRSDVMAAITEGQQTIAVAGAHGKTTTTSMIAHILLETGRDPSYIIGGVLRSTGRNAALGTGSAFVVEADEYDHMFLGLRPRVEVITNVEYDHPDFFPTTEAMLDSFRQFVRLLPPEGLLVACGDNPAANALAETRLSFGLSATTYSLESPYSIWRATDLRTEEGYDSVFDVTRYGNTLGTARLRVPGRHNVLNAMAALVVVHSQDVSILAAAEVLASFEGAGRRFELRGEVDGVLVIDDYAHHPTAIKMNLQAAKQRYPDHDLWAVWQPHTYSRTRALWDDYLAAFDDADHVLVTDIYAAREAPVSGVTSAALVAEMQHPDARHTRGLMDAAALLDKKVQAPAVILIMSAGDAPQIGVEFLKRRQSKASVSKRRERRT